GVCLGAQLLASALGAQVYRNTVKEIGWFPVEAVAGPSDAFHFPQSCNVFHWHGETFDLPQGAVLLAKSAACVNQAFQIRKNVIGLQFHLETTPESARRLIENCPEDLTPGPYVQSVAELLSTASAAYTDVHHVMNRVLSYVTQSTD